MVRNITVYEKEAQRKTVFENVDVNTLADIKTLLDNKGINYYNMEFLEGVSKVRLMVDDSVLPNNIPYKGSVTNDLVILMTLKNEKISSGAQTRQDLYNFIKTNHLEEAIKEEFGKNFTNVSTLDLINFAADHACVEEKPEKSLTEKAKEIIENLYNYGHVTEDEYKVLCDAILGAKEAQEDDSKGFSRSEIEEMIDSLNF